MEQTIGRWRVVVGWLTVGVTLLIASFWAFWGGNEAFHEGWYHHHLGKNLLMVFGQHLLPMEIFIVVALVALRWPLVGAAVHVAAGFWVIWFFWGAHPGTLAQLYGFLFLLAVGYAVGRPVPKRRAYWLVVAVPFLVATVFAAGPAVRVAGRVDDMERGERRVTGNGVDLVWAPAGPGWPQQLGGATWEEAVEACRHLSEDGTRLMPVAQDIWRLPTVEEFVRSQHRRGENCGGRWDAASGRATYERAPDKESPLWATDSNVIYWWVGREVDAERGWKASYLGRVQPASKLSSFGYWGFRAVREPAGAPAPDAIGSGAS